jgi:hypothetical protein
MTPNSTNARRKIENVASRAAGNGARIRNLRTESSRNQVARLMLVHKHAFVRATPVGARHQRAPGSGQPGSSVQQKHYREPRVACAVEGKSKISHFPYTRSEPGFGFCAKNACRQQLPSPGARPPLPTYWHARDPLCEIQYNPCLEFRCRFVGRVRYAWLRVSSCVSNAARHRA